MSRPIRSMLALAAALLAAAAAPAPAQTATAAVTRPIASYRLATGRAGSALPTEVTIADSAGALVASFRLAGEPVAQPMLVLAFDSDLVLQGETPNGVLTLHLRGENAAEPHAVHGQWWLGERLAGSLRGRTVR